MGFTGAFPQETKFIIMKYAPGETFNIAINGNGSVAETAQLTQQIAGNTAFVKNELAVVVSDTVVPTGQVSELISLATRPGANSAQSLFPVVEMK